MSTSSDFFGTSKTTEKFTKDKTNGIGSSDFTPKPHQQNPFKNIQSNTITQFLSTHPETKKLNKILTLISCKSKTLIFQIPKRKPQFLRIRGFSSLPVDGIWRSFGGVKKKGLRSNRTAPRKRFRREFEPESERENERKCEKTLGKIKRGNFVI